MASPLVDTCLAAVSRNGKGTLESQFVTNGMGTQDSEPAGK